ncbi:inner membrane transporter RhtA [Salana multivorans]|uniref:Inner membrane transporter RhtA n=1 Tax=Salana multivorans TaxID=120377 RepID=A0A3N2DBQ6_9MICO|nr:EamA family transporter [Salana multivorans]ROR97206.1 inner membrane transporter RhtA [Salana multivorans]
MSRVRGGDRDGAGARLAAAVPAPALFLGAGVSMYYGAALAVGLFAVAGAVSVGWARLVVAAAVLLLLARPWSLPWTRRGLVAAAAFGVLLGAMNLLFYVAIDHLPLGAAVAVEFIGPVTVAVVTAGAGTAPWRRIVPPLLAAGGVAAISFGEIDWSALEAGSGVGVLFALAAGAAWAGYMVLGRRIAARASAQHAGSGDGADGDGADGDGADGGGVGAVAAAGAVVEVAAAEAAGRSRPTPGPLRTGMASLALGMTTAAILYAVVGAPGAGPLIGSWSALGLVVGVAVLSSVVPYALDQVSMQRLSTSQFALLNALLPATATLVGFVSLRQVPAAAELVGVAAISAAVALATRR